MGLWRRDATRNTCITARAYTETFTFNARMKQRKLNQHSCITDKVVDRISTRKLHFNEMCSKMVQYITSSLNVDYLVLDEFNDFDIQRTVHRVQWKPTRCTISQIYLIKYSTCFRQVHFPSSGVSQHFIHAIIICHSSSVGVCYRGQDPDATRKKLTVSLGFYILVFSIWWS
jgi:hypothetical protein